MAWESKNGVFLIAEIGGNHEGDFSYAKRLVTLACESGVDAVKFQIYTGDSLVSPVEGAVRNEHFKKFELSQEQHIQLAEVCRERNVMYNASVWDISAIDWIDPYLAFYKIGSGDLTALPVLKKIASKKKPILISTGLATLEEVEETFNYLKEQDDYYLNTPESIAILQCTSMYPIPAEEANLNVMDTFKNAFQAPVGYSDHTEGTLAIETAVAMGAEIIEFHFTDSREGKEFRDHKVSLTGEEVKALIDKIHEIQTVQGSAVKEPTKAEITSEHIDSFRRAVYPANDIEAGTVITEDHIITLRPNHGIDARAYYDLIGKKLLRSVKAFERLNKEDFG